MTKQEIEAVFERVRTWPEDRKAYAAVLLLGLEQYGDKVFELSDEERVELDRAEASGVAPEAEVESLLGQYR